MRIISGDLGGRRLLAPRGLDTRPTADRVKEALFNILGPPAPAPGRRFRVLDLFCGSGALGLEALSRGADEALFVDEDSKAVQATERNLEELGLLARGRVIRREVGATLIGLEGPFDWVFLDPPYDGGALDRALRLLGSRPIVDDAGVACAEHHSRNPPAERYGALALAGRRRWGETVVSFYRTEGRTEGRTDGRPATEGSPPDPGPTGPKGSGDGDGGEPTP